MFTRKQQTSPFLILNPDEKGKAKGNGWAAPGRRPMGSNRRPIILQILEEQREWI
jgi:hypothetical protein